jgi:8-oxo-dGTP pyrophosphatase MutT (NUDIX family)
MVFTLRRPAARVVLLDRAGRIFLVNSEDPADHRKPPWWEIPGGGVDVGESSEDACRRELLEETGIEDIEMGPCIWTQHVEFDFGGLHFDSNERIHVAWCDGGEFRPRHLEFLEAAAFMGARWWALDELLASDEPVLPTRLREFLPAIVRGDLPDEPIDISPRPLG